MRFGPDPAGRRLSRLTKRPQFLAAASGRRSHVSTCTVQALAREPDGDGLRVGFTITKKVGHATERNRVRRRLRAAMRVVGSPRIDDPLDLVVVGRRDTLTRPFPALLNDLERAISGALRPRRTPGAGPSAPTDTAASPLAAPTASSAAAPHA